MTDYFTSGQGRLWVQEEGALSPWEYWGCASISDISIPEGDLTAFYCPSKSKREDFEIVAEVQGSGGFVTTSIEMPRSATTRLLALDCPFNILILYSRCARPDDKSDWIVADYLHNARITARTIAGPTAREPDGQTLLLVTAEVSARWHQEWCFPQYTQQCTPGAEPGDFNDVHFCDDPSCGGECGDATVGCQVGFMVGTAGLINKTANGGSTCNTLTPPTGWDADDVTAVYCKGDFVIVGSGTDDETAISNDAGSSWTVIDLSSLLSGATVTSIWGLDKYNLWLAATGGLLLYSNDGGLTWEDRSPESDQDLNDVMFLDEDQGICIGEVYSGEGYIATTENGGLTWSTRTSGGTNAFNACVRTDDNIMLVVGDSGDMYYSTDGGDNWTEKETEGSDNIMDISFPIDQPNVGYYCTAGGDVYRTFDGGYSWMAETLAGTPGSLNAIFACTPNTVNVVGEDEYFGRGSCGNEAASA